MKILALLCLSYGLLSQAQTAKQNCALTPRLTKDNLTEFIDCHGKVIIPARKPAPSPSASPTPAAGEESGGLFFADADTAKAYQNSIRERFNYEAESWRHRQKVFDWQHTSSVWIFWVVIVLVLGGLGLATLQFLEANKAQRVRTDLAVKHTETPVKPAAPDAASHEVQTADPAVTTLDLSLKGIKISSSVIGLIVLAMSMGFFYLYVKFIYPSRLSVATKS